MHVTKCITHSYQYVNALKLELYSDVSFIKHSRIFGQSNYNVNLVNDRKHTEHFVEFS